MSSHEQWLRTLADACEASLERLPSNEPATIALRQDVTELLARIRTELTEIDRAAAAT